MEYKIKKLEKFSSDSPVLRLLRNPDAMFFLHREFIETGRTAIPASEMEDLFEKFLLSPEGKNLKVSNIHKFLDKWTTEESWTFKNSSNQYELSSNAHKAFRIYDDIKSDEDINFSASVHEHVGSIVTTLRELIIMSDNIDATMRIQKIDEQIEEYKKKIEESEKMKERLSADGFVTPENSNQDLNKFNFMLKNLQVFPQNIQVVIGRMRVLLNDLKKKILEGNLSNQEILDFQCNGLLNIESSGEGRDFCDFRDFLTDQNIISTMIESLRSLENHPTLGAIAQREKPWKILDITQKQFNSYSRALGKHLNQIRTLLNHDSYVRKTAIYQTLEKIKIRLIEHKDNPSAPRPRLSVYEKPPFPNRSAFFAELTMRPSSETSILDISEEEKYAPLLLEDYSLDTKKLHRNLIEILSQKGEARLSEIVRAYPPMPEAMLEEILWYLSADGVFREVSLDMFTFQARNRIHEDVVESFVLSDILLKKENP